VLAALERRNQSQANALELASPLASLRQRWQQIAKTDYKDFETAWSEVAPLERDITLLMESVLDNSGIALDPEAGAYYLSQVLFFDIPATTSEIAQVRGLGSAVMAAHELSPDQGAQIVQRLGAADNAQTRMSRFLAKAAKQVPAAGPLAKASKAELEEAISRLDFSTKVGLLSSTFVGTAGDYFGGVDQVVRVPIGMAKSLTPLVQYEFDRRIRQGRREALFSLGLTMLAALLMVGGLWAVYRGMRTTANHLITSLKRLADGQLDVAFDMSTKDELGVIARQLGETTDAWRTMIQKASGGKVPCCIARLPSCLRDLARSCWQPMWK
jgi:methyl-accepting chemotaxis protein-1 (serine sensor receptor)